MSKNTRPNPRNFFLMWALVGLCLVLLSSHITAGPYAKFTSSSSGSDGARVIRFGQLTVTETGDFTTVGGENRFVFTPGVPVNKQLTVDFGGSEASTYVFVSVTTTGWTINNKVNFTDSKGQLSWSVADGWTHLQSNGDTHVYYISLDPNTPLENKAFIKDGTIAVSTSGTVAMYESYPSTSFTVQGSVVQANKFDTPAAAWASLSSKY